MERQWWRGAAVVALVKMLVCAGVLASGFRAVSDDDYARVEIAEQWAHAPRLDPSGTSWLPFPFWLNGIVLAVGGRGLGAARVAAVALGLVAALLVYTAARWVGQGGRAAAWGAVVAAVFPWSARLGVATVPELPAAALVLVGAASLGSWGEVREGRRLWGAAALWVASLSRYEAWPVALLFAARCLLDAARTRSIKVALAAVMALAGPAAWVGWNWVAHGDALHFLARVAAYRQALGGSEGSLGTRLWAYPAAMVQQEPEMVVVLVASAVLVAMRQGRVVCREVLARFAGTAAVLAVQVAALSAAMLKDGAPTHHPERAVLAALLWIAVGAGALVSRLRSKDLVALAAIAGLVAATVRPRMPRESFAARGDEEAAGRAVAALAAPGDRVLVEVADYGYLAVTAALGRPEDVLPDRSMDPRDPKVSSSFEQPATLARRVATSGARWVVARVTGTTRAVLGEPLVVRGAWGVFPIRRSDA